jgi:hypothetical protein
MWQCFPLLLIETSIKIPEKESAAMLTIWNAVSEAFQEIEDLIVKNKPQSKNGGKSFSPDTPAQRYNRVTLHFADSASLLQR